MDERIQILIVEDSPTQAALLRYLLEKQGYAVTAAGNGREALEASRLRKPRLVVSDVEMPEMDGYAMCRAIKADPQLQGVPVLLLTSLTDPADALRGVEARADDCLPKPYERTELLARIAAILSAKSTAIVSGHPPMPTIRG